MKNLYSSESLILVLCFLATLVVTSLDPLWLNPNGIQESTALPIVYFIPTILLWFYYFAKPKLFGSKSLNDAQKRELLYVQIKSIIRKVLAVLAAFIFTGFAKNIPYIEFINTIITYIAENLDVSIKALEVLIGVALGLVSHFSKINRFEERITLHPRKVEL